METPQGWKMPLHWKAGFLLAGAGILLGAVKGPDWLSDGYSPDTGFQTTLDDGTKLTALADLACGGSRNDEIGGTIHLVTERPGYEPGGRSISPRLVTEPFGCDEAIDKLEQDPSPLLGAIIRDVHDLPSDGSQDGDPGKAAEYLGDYQDMFPQPTTPVTG
jgi:hypothetical protein